ncbi:MAG TPA: asparagine synthase (glutamine-hydrolyzing) [Pyrinomonadaceae bacterium]|nr:asparagine synthase (glutamine-hydrolyzing) [Pyrinomonadaceae bacterium]
MCGIVGVLSFNNSAFRVSEPYLVRMRDVMSHRGPDGAGIFVSPDRRLGLGFRRLAIIDLSERAMQPMSNEDGTLWVVFNGEIYNHAEIRAELESRGGHRWKTDHSDTEVILHAFEEWGIECVHKFRGMFAIALWDTKQRQLWLIRDRIGVKPLYYSIHHGRITFASEIKALLEDEQQPRDVNEEALYYYLSFNATPAPLTLFSGIQKLAPGTWLRVNEDGHVQECRYWDVWDHTQPLTNVSEDEIAERILSELRTSVKLRKISDVPVGVFLSGGIDSSTNAALFSEGDGQPVKTFSIGYDREYESYPSELGYARKIAQKVGADHHELLLKESDLLESLPLIIRHQDEPLADPVCMPVYYVSKLARDAGVIVCQVGEGSDELFWGYKYWRDSLRLQRFSNSLPIPNALRNLGLAGLNFVERGRNASYRRQFSCEVLRRALSNRPVFWGGAEVLSDSQKRQFLSPRLLKKFKELSSWEALRPIRQRFEEKSWEPSPLNWMTYLDLNVRLPELLLMRVDKMSMAVSLEARVPFLDHKFVELAMSIPEAVKTRKGVLKYILKKAVRGVIPDELIDRKKQGFGVPVYEWYQTKFGEHLVKETKDFCENTDLFRFEEVLPFLPKRGWALLNLALWWKQYIGSESTPPQPFLAPASLRSESNSHRNISLPVEPNMGTASTAQSGGRS